MASPGGRRSRGRLVGATRHSTSMRILVVNAGSSSVKLRVLDDADELLASADLPVRDAKLDARAVAVAVSALVSHFGPIDAVGHRIVHGGTELTTAVRVTDDVLARLEALADLAPLHQPITLGALAAVRDALPEVPSIACFDTAFHATLPPEAATYALPREWRERWGLRRFGFHGLSHAYASRRAAELLGRSTPGFRVVTCHLGAGASLAAVRDGRSVDTTMGFTPLDGLVMATRSGSVDPGLVLWLQEHAGMTAGDLSDALEHRSGLVGLAGSADMREVLERQAAGDADAALAVGVYLHRLRGAIAAMVASLDGLDALVFTGGVGENAAAVRSRAADGLAFLGLVVDPAVNEANLATDHAIAPGSSPVAVLLVLAREDLEIARQVREVIQ